MANYANLKAAISAAIKTNGNKEITGQVLQNVLNSIVSVIGANYTFAGVATPSTNPGTPDQNVVYMASQGGTYTNFNGIVLPAGISLLMWNGTWTSKTVMCGDGGVFDISVYKASGGTLATFADLAAALNGGNNIPTSARKGGMSVKFVQSSDNNYVQYRLMRSTFTASQFANTTNWQGVDEVLSTNSKNLVESRAVLGKYGKYSTVAKDSSVNLDITNNVVIGKNYVKTALKNTSKSFKIIYAVNGGSWQDALASTTADGEWHEFTIPQYSNSIVVYFQSSSYAGDIILFSGDVGELKKDVVNITEIVENIDNELVGQNVVFESKFTFNGDHSSRLDAISYPFKSNDVLNINFLMTNEGINNGYVVIYFRKNGSEVQSASINLSNARRIKIILNQDADEFGFYFNATSSIVFHAITLVNVDNNLTTDNSVNSISENQVVGFNSQILSVPQNCNPYGFYTGTGNIFAWGNRISGVVQGEKYTINIITQDIDMTGVTITNASRLSVLFTKKDGSTIAQEIVHIPEGGMIPALQSRYIITIPENTEYLQIGGRCAEGQIFKAFLSHAQESDKNLSLEYYGEPIRIAKNKYGRDTYKSLSPSFWHQSMAIYGDYAVFMINDYNVNGEVSEGALTMHIYSISSGTKLASINVPYGNYTIPHCNTSVFGKEFASEKSIAPLLYVSQWNGERNCLVYDITLDNGVYSVELKQVIGTSGINQNIEGIGMRDWVVDIDNNAIYSIAYYTNSDADPTGNKTMFVKFPLPSLSDGNIVFGEQDVLDHFELEFFKYFQDKCYNANKIYIASGMQNFQSITNIRVIDLNTQRIVTVIPLGDTYNSEPEGLDIYKDALLITYGSMTLYEISTN